MDDDAAPHTGLAERISMRHIGKTIAAEASHPNLSFESPIVTAILRALSKSKILSSA
jgi:hypothetical protein